MATDPPERLVPLLKQALARLTTEVNEALAPYGIDGRELAVLRTLAVTSATPMSQQQGAAALGIDRTTMVALVDALEAKGLVERRPHPDDRRKNVVELTDAGHTTLRQAGRAGDDAEHRFLAPLGRDAARHLKASLQALVTEAASPAPLQP